MVESFEDSMAHLMIMVEEFKESLLSPNSVLSPESIVFQLDNLMDRLEGLKRQQEDYPEDSVKKEIYQYCRKKIQSVAMNAFKRTVQPSGVDQKTEVYDDDVPGQAAIARMAELNLIILNVMIQEEDQTLQVKTSDQIDTLNVIQLYADYQKQVLRQRAKPAIVYLANWRQSDFKDQNQAGLEDNDGDDGVITHPYSHTLTLVLGHSSALIHPLQQWSDALMQDSTTFQLCMTSIKTLNEQTETLVATICNWFLEDKKVEEWMKEHQNRQHQSPRQQQVVKPSKSINVSELDSLVEEMAFFCQIMARYDALMDSSQVILEKRVIPSTILPEWTWKYAFLERSLGLEQLRSALDLASPVEIVIGSNIQVPSVVEDAQYLSTRALDRAMSTRNAQAMGTVAHSISHDIWSTDGGGVHRALMEQRGCFSILDSPSKKPKANNVTPQNGDFASALLDALDEDLKMSKVTSPVSAPHSSGFLGSLVLGGDSGQIRLDAQLCSLNGSFAASTACHSLSESLGMWLESQEDRMIALAREELMQFSVSYKALLEQQVQEIIREWCGSLEPNQPSLKGKCFHTIRDFIERENYQLGATTITAAESNDRLEAHLLSPLHTCQFLSQMEKCEDDVKLAICNEISRQISNVIMESLWRAKKAFNDWGSMLLSKQVRLLQSFVIQLLGNKVSSTSILEEWERLSQVVTVLQLERPADWSIYQSTSVLGKDELYQTMILRVDFSVDAIANVCQAYSPE